MSKETLKLALEAYLCREMPAGTIIGDPKWWASKIAKVLAQDALQALHDESKSLGLYEKGYADAMNWKVQNHLEHLPAAQPEQEPVAYINVDKRSLEWASPTRWLTPTVAKMERVALYTTPPQRKPLTDEQIEACIHHVDEDGIGLFAFARAIETKLKEKNT